MTIKKRFFTLPTLVAACLVSVVLASLFTTLLIKKHLKNNKAPRVDNTELDPSTVEGFYQIVDQIQYFNEWPRYEVKNYNYSFEYPSEFTVFEKPTSVELFLTAYQEDQSMPGIEATPNFYSVQVLPGPLSTLQGEFSDTTSYKSSNHTEKFGDNTFMITKAAIIDGPCAGNYTFRAILPHENQFIVVDNSGCGIVKGNDSRFFERFLDSFKVE